MGEAAAAIVEQPPYGIIAPAMQRGGVVPFLGAAVNYGARPAGAKWDVKADFLPDGRELSSYLADKSEFPSTDPHDRNDLAKVASFFVERGSRDDLRLCLQGIFNRPYGPAPIHRCLAEIAGAAAAHPMLVVTTNYDDLTEQAFANQPYDLVTHLTDRDDWAGSVVLWRHEPGSPPGQPQAVNPLELDHYVDLSKRSVIYKMHGAVDRTFDPPQWDSFVISEDDYVDFLSRMAKKSAIPPAFINHCGSRRFLFIGYGLRDWNFRVVLRDLFANRPAKLGTSWAIQKGTGTLEPALWQQRGVKIFDCDVTEFSTALLNEFRQLAAPAPVAAAPAPGAPAAPVAAPVAGVANGGGL